MTIAERNAEIVHAYVRDALPMRAIATRYGLSYTQVHRIIRSGDVVLRSRLRQNVPWSKVEVGALVEHWPFLSTLLGLMPDRTKDAIRGKARSLGLDGRGSHSLRRAS